MVSGNSESIAGINSPQFSLNSELVMVLGASLVISILVITLTRRLRKHQNPKVEEYLKKSDISASDIENQVTIRQFLDGYDSYEDEDEIEIFVAENVKSVVCVGDERFII